MVTENLCTCVLLLGGQSQVADLFATRPVWSLHALLLMGCVTPACVGGVYLLHLLACACSNDIHYTHVRPNPGKLFSVCGFFGLYLGCTYVHLESITSKL
jgi:hypothetical protein